MVWVLVRQFFLSVFARGTFRRVKIILKIHLRATFHEIMLDPLRTFLERKVALLIYSNRDVFALVLPVEIVAGALIERLQREK